MELLNKQMEDVQGLSGAQQPLARLSDWVDDTRKTYSLQTKHIGINERTLAVALTSCTSEKAGEASSKR